MLSLAQTIKDLKNNIVNILNTMAPKTYVDKKVADLVNGAPEQLDTLQELSQALNNDKDFGATVNNAIAKKLDSAGGTITGNLTVNGVLTAKASTAGTADRALKADTCTGNAATASSVPWSGVTNKPTTFTPSAHNHAWNNITGTPATATRWPSWNEVTDKPASLPPAAHNHDSLYPSTTGTRASGTWEINITGSAGGVAWANVSGKPTSFTPAGHSHGWGDITGAPATATRWPTWDEVSGKPTSFTPTITAEVAGTAPAAGQIVRVNSLGALITNDLLKTVRAAGTDVDINKLVAEPISMKEMFSNWQRISCSVNGQNQNSNGSDQTIARACYYYDDNTRTIVCPNNSDPFSAFVSSDSYAPDYRVKYQLTGRDGDDDGLCFIAGFMVDKAGKFHTLTVWRVGDNETQAPDPISDYKASSHQARFAICYDVYAAWMPQSPNGIVLARTVAPLKTSWNTNTCLCEVQKTSTQIIAKTADVNSTDMKYTLTFTLPSSKPADWSQEAYDNIKFMMQNSSQIGFGTQSNPCSFKILEQTGSITAITVYNVNTGKKLTYMNGAKQSEVDDSNVLTPGCFLYSTITKKLFYVKNKDMVVLIDNGGEDILTNKNVVKNGTPTKDISLRYETENGKNVVAPYVDGVKVPLSLQDANAGKLVQLYWIDHTENYYRTWQLATKYDEKEYILHNFSHWIIPVFNFKEAYPSGSAAGEKPDYGYHNYWIEFPNAESEVINAEWMSESDIISYIKNSIMPKYNLTAVRYQGSIEDTKYEGIVTQ